MIELQGFISWLAEQHSDEECIILKAVETYFAEALDGTATLRVDYAEIQKAVQPKDHEKLQDLWDDYSQDYPVVRTN